MKKRLGIVILAVLAAACLVYVPAEDGPYSRPRQEDRYDRYDEETSDVDISYFYEHLSPYGTWVNNAPYGYVWVPRVGYSWRPYTYGRWVWTDYGWTFVSRDRWGWAVFHYGRWGWERGLGWFWVPDTVWAPAWVSWRWGGPYVGWAPIPPGVAFSWRTGIGRRDYDIPGHTWSFLHGRNFLDRDLDRYVLPYERNRTIIDVTSLRGDVRVRNGRVVNDGVDVDVVSRATQREVSRLTLRDAPRPGEDGVDDDAVRIYRPSVARNESARPKDVLEKDEAERQAGRGTLGGTVRRGDVREPENEDLDELQLREKRLLDESQSEEMTEIRRRADEDKGLARNNEDKKKIEAENQAKISEIKKRHDTEKSELDRRQKDEKSTVQKGRIKKKDD
jgi:hypothetical protein